MATPPAKGGKQALGKGIRALLSSMDDDLKGSAAPHAEGLAAAPATAGTARIAVDAIEVNPDQPRRDFDPEALRELSESIALHDIIQPVTVTKVGPGKWQLISGERRLRAARQAGLKDIPAYVRAASGEGERLELALLENLQRQDLNAIEIALSYKRLMEEVGLTQEGVAERMKKERSTVTNYLRLLKLPPDIQRAVRDGGLSMGHARAIIALEQVDQQLYAYRETLEKGLSVRQTEALVKALMSEGPAIKKSAPARKLPVAYKRIEDNMASHFSTKVVLDRKANGKGSVTLEFYSDEDLERMMEKMGL